MPLRGQNRLCELLRQQAARGEQDAIVVAFGQNNRQVPPLDLAAARFEHIHLSQWGRLRGYRKTKSISTITFVRMTFDGL